MIGFEHSIGNMIIGNSTLIKQVQRGTFQSYSNRLLFLPPSLEVYTVLSLQGYFIVYCVTLLCQTGVIFALDNWWLKNIPANTSLLKRILHAHLKSHFPFPFMDWDSEKGTRENYVLRHKVAQKEVKITTLVNLFFSLLMTFPLTILCKYHIIFPSIQFNSACHFYYNNFEFTLFTLLRSGSEWPFDQA